jgi:phosphoadenosine phosphosulfate reductase
MSTTDLSPLSGAALARDLAAEWATLHPRTQLAAALDRFGDALLVTTALGAGGVVLAAWLSELAPDRASILIDTGKLFPETLAYRDALIAEHGLRIQTVAAVADERAFVTEHGESLWESNPDRCCAIRKVAPNAALLSGKQAWISALRRDQGGERASVGAAAWDSRGVVKLQPLAAWTRVDVDAELERRAIPQHPLVAYGYRSVGCWPCTSPARDGEGERAGRWAGRAKTECGLHTDPATLNPKQ